VNGNSIAEWKEDIQLAKAAHIDAFALNVAAQDSANAASLSYAFTAANEVGNSKLFFSFDYAAQGEWPASSAINLLHQYGPNQSYFQYHGKPMVSTFEGSSNADDWISIKAQTNCFFIPDWSSIEPSAALAKAGGVVDGLFSWNAWPNGCNDMTTTSDLAYTSALASKPYMMPISPWFHTNLPHWNKNWLWRGDSLWYDRWQQVLSLAPEFVQIISWNDYGESHYIGPLRSKNMGLFEYGGAPYNYAENKAHDGWRNFLPYVIDTYKNGYQPVIEEEKLVIWYRTNPGYAGGTGGTTGNTASHGQTELHPSLVSVDAIFFSALLRSVASVAVSIGGVTVEGTWRNVPTGGSGIYHGSVPFGGKTGEVVVRVWRMVDGVKTTVAQVTGSAITTVCQKGMVNWNAWVDASPVSSV
jgi:hypothetical protein